jgi:glycosyltransferase involved in cell wall biosynthesis
VINNGIDLASFSPRHDVEHEVERPGCIFVGYLDYRANVIGLQWFCQNVWRELVRIHPGATFSIVGRNATREVRRLESIPGVEVVGSVNDVRPLIAGTNIVVVPLLVARGIQNKILEAMAMGKAVVASPAALAGIGARPGKEIIEADAPGEWIARIVDLWGDAQRRRQIGEQARRFVETHHDWRHCLAPLVNMCSGRRVAEKRTASDFSTRPRLAGVIG